MNQDWTYKHADITKNDLELISQELALVWQDYTHNKNYNTCKFIYLLADADVRSKCTNLIKEVTRMGLNEILEGVGFLVVPPGCYTPLHLDNGVTTTLSLPVINCSNSFTVWYKDPEPLNLETDLDCLGQDILGQDIILNPGSATQSLVEYMKGATIPYFKIDPEREMDRVECTSALWLNASIPHRPEVLHNNLRVLATLRFTQIPKIFS